MMCANGTMMTMHINPPLARTHSSPTPHTHSHTRSLIAPLLLLLLTVVLARGAEWGAWLNIVLTSIKMSVIVLVCLVGLLHLHPPNWLPFFPKGVAAVFPTTATVFFSYVGFDTIASSSEECKNPLRCVVVFFFVFVLCFGRAAALVLGVNGGSGRSTVFDGRNPSTYRPKHTHIHIHTHTHTGTCPAPSCSPSPCASRSTARYASSSRGWCPTTKSTSPPPSPAPSGGKYSTRVVFKMWRKVLGRSMRPGTSINASQVRNHPNPTQREQAGPAVGAGGHQFRWGGRSSHHAAHRALRPGPHLLGQSVHSESWAAGGRNQRLNNDRPSNQPTNQLTNQPTQPTDQPTNQPTNQPTKLKSTPTQEPPIHTCPPLTPTDQPQGIARDGLLPPALADVHPTFKTPAKAQMLCGVAAMLLAGLVNVKLLSELLDIGVIIGYGRCVCVCAGWDVG
jgi:hypothetical protein